MRVSAFFFLIFNFCNHNFCHFFLLSNPLNLKPTFPTIRCFANPYKKKHWFLFLSTPHLHFYGKIKFITHIISTQIKQRISLAFNFSFFFFPLLAAFCVMLLVFFSVSLSSINFAVYVARFMANGFKQVVWKIDVQCKIRNLNTVCQNIFHGQISCILFGFVLISSFHLLNHYWFWCFSFSFALLLWICVCVSKCFFFVSFQNKIQILELKHFTICRCTS